MNLVCRVYALFVTDRVCAQPLTHAIHYNDLSHADYEEVRGTARVLKSLVLGTNKLYSEMQLLKEQQDPLQRSDMLTRGVPYPLRDTLRCVHSLLVCLCFFSLLTAASIQHARC